MIQINSEAPVIEIFTAVHKPSLEIRYLATFFAISIPFLTILPTKFAAFLIPFFITLIDFTAKRATLLKVLFIRWPIYLTTLFKLLVTFEIP